MSGMCELAVSCTVLICSDVVCNGLKGINGSCKRPALLQGSRI